LTEAKRLASSRQASPEGQKTLKYGTRDLFTSSPWTARQGWQDAQ